MEKRFHSIAEVLADLQKKSKNPSLETKSEGIESYNCSACKDKGFILENVPALDEVGNQRVWPT